MDEVTDTQTQTEPGPGLLIPEDVYLTSGVHIGALLMSADM